MVSGIQMEALPVRIVGDVDQLMVIEADLIAVDLLKLGEILARLGENHGRIGLTGEVDAVGGGGVVDVVAVVTGGGDARGLEQHMVDTVHIDHLRLQGVSDPPGLVPAHVTRIAQLTTQVESGTVDVAIPSDTVLGRIHQHVITVSRSNAVDVILYGLGMIVPAASRKHLIRAVLGHEAEERIIVGGIIGADTQRKALAITLFGVSKYIAYTVTGQVANRKPLDIGNTHTLGNSVEVRIALGLTHFLGMRAKESVATAKHGAETGSVLLKPNNISAAIVVDIAHGNEAVCIGERQSNRLNSGKALACIHHGGDGVPVDHNEIA